MAVHAETTVHFDMSAYGNEAVVQQPERGFDRLWSQRGLAEYTLSGQIERTVPSNQLGIVHSHDHTRGGK